MHLKRKLNGCKDGWLIVTDTEFHIEYDFEKDKIVIRQNEIQKYIKAWIKNYNKYESMKRKSHSFNCRRKGKLDMLICIGCGEMYDGVHLKEGCLIIRNRKQLDWMLDELRSCGDMAHMLRNQTLSGSQQQFITPSNMYYMRNPQANRYGTGSMKRNPIRIMVILVVVVGIISELKNYVGEINIPWPVTNNDSEKHISVLKDDEIKSDPFIIKEKMKNDPLKIANIIQGKDDYISRMLLVGNNVKNSNLKGRSLLKYVSQELQLDCYDDMNKVRKIHDYLICNTEYDYEFYRELQNATASQLYYAKYERGPDYGQDTDTVLKSGTAVCEGYANAFKDICAYNHINTRFISGTATNELGTNSHAWNQVFIEEEWFNVDVTWDDPVRIGEQNSEYVSETVLRYDYFLKPDKFFKADHTANSVADVFPVTVDCISDKYNALSEQYSLAAKLDSINYCYIKSADEINQALDYAQTYDAKPFYIIRETDQGMNNMEDYEKILNDHISCVMQAMTNRGTRYWTAVSADMTSKYVIVKLM